MCIKLFPKLYLLSLRSIHFCMRLNQMSKHFCYSDWSISEIAFLKYQLLLQVSKNVDPSFYFLRTGINRSHSVTSQNYTTDDSSIDALSAQKCSCLSRCVRARIVVVIRLRRLIFLITWKTTGKQIVVYHSELTILRCFSGTIVTCTIFLKKQVIICLEVLRAQATFIRFGSSWNTHTVDCCLLSSSYA